MNMRCEVPGLTVHVATNGMWPQYSVALLARWTAAAVAHCEILAGLPPLPKETHLWIKTTKKLASYGYTLTNGHATVYLPVDAYPHGGGDGRFPSSIDFQLYDWAEALVATAAHELTHLRGAPGLLKKGASSKVYKILSGERISEQFCQVVSLQVLEQFRIIRAGLETQLQIPIYVIE